MLKFEKQNQKQLKTMITSSINLVDAFSLQPPLRILKQQRFSTQIGKLTSIGLLIIFLIQFVIALRGVLNYDQVNVVSKQINKSNMEPMYFTPNNFTLALTFLTTKQDAIINLNSYLNITVKNCQILRSFDSNGKLNITQNCFYYPIEQCSMEDHFPTDAQKTMFASQNLSNLYCLQNDVWKNRSVVLQGTYADDNYHSLTIIASLCQNTTQTDICAPQSEIEETLKLFFYGYYYNDLLIQQDSVNRPLQPLIGFIVTPISYGLTKSLLLENQIQQIETDSGLILENMIQQQGLKIYNTPSSSDPYNGQYLLQHLIKQYNIVMNYKRTYPKVQTILGQLGGLWQLMYYATLLLINPIISMNMNMALANKLFSFSSNDDLELDYINDKSQSLKKKQGGHITVLQFISNDNLILQDSSAQFLKSKKDSLDMNIQSILLQLCGCRKQEQQQLDYAQQKILNKLDVSYILTKLIEIDKLKLVLLTKDQRHLFNHLPKPIIPKALFNATKRSQIDDNPKYEIILQEEKSDLMKLQDAFGAYKNIAMNSELDLNPIDLTLLNQLDTDIYNLFKQIDQEGSDLRSCCPFKKSLLQSLDVSNNHQVLQSDSRRRDVLSQSQVDLEEQAQVPR